MLVHGAFVPPRDALDELIGVVQSVRREVSPEPQKRRLLRRKAEAPAPDAPPVLVDLPLESMTLPITAFGNLTSSDIRRLVDALSEAATAWQRPTLRFSGGGALEFPGDRAVWARLDGDLHSLSDIARGVTTCVEKLGLFVDRRTFRPMLAVATVTESTVGEDLERVVGALHDLQGRPWEIDSVVLTVDPGGDGNVQEYQRVPVG